MQLPNQAAAKAQQFLGLSEDRKKQIIEHLALVPELKGKEVVDVLIANGGPEADFVKAIFNPQAIAAAKPVRATKA